MSMATLSRTIILHQVEFLIGTYLRQYPNGADEVVMRAIWPRLLFTKAGKRTTTGVWLAINGTELVQPTGILHECTSNLTDHLDGVEANKKLIQRIAGASPLAQAGHAHCLASRPFL